MRDYPKDETPRGITVSDFLKTKLLTFAEVKETFNLVKEIDVDFSSVKGCANCGDTANQYSVDCEPWVGARQCIACQSLVMVVFQDRMGGARTDAVFVFEQKNRPMYRLYYKCDIQKDCILCRVCNTQSSDPEDIKNLFCKTCNKTLK